MFLRASLTVLICELSVFTSRLSLSMSSLKAGVGDYAITLYSSLGGGWGLEGASFLGTGGGNYSR
jgi:hypothetical protein